MSDADLIRRLEEATGPSVKLDRAIAVALGWQECAGAWRESPAVEWSMSLPAWSGSLDAAVALVPEGHRWLLDRRPQADQRQDGYRAQVYKEAHPYASDMHDIATAWAPTPALALVIAAMRARQG